MTPKRAKQLILLLDPTAYSVASANGDFANGDFYISSSIQVHTGSVSKGMCGFAKISKQAWIQVLKDIEKEMENDPGAYIFIYGKTSKCRWSKEAQSFYPV